MNNFDPHRYTISIKLVTLEEGEHFEALVAELPDLVEYGETYDQAYSLAVDSITMLNEAALEQGRDFPKPMPSQALEEFSGRVTLRMSKSLHASVSKLADREGVSLNSWIVEAMSARIGTGFFTYLPEQRQDRENHALGMLGGFICAAGIGKTMSNLGPNSMRVIYSPYPDQPMNDPFIINDNWEQMNMNMNKTAISILVQ